MTNQISAQSTSQAPGDRLARIQARIDAACRTSGRDPDTVSLLAVSKGQPLHALKTLIASGQQAFGENYLDEALEKIAALADAPLTWHFIGPIQSNKTRAIAENFDWVHSVDRAKIIRRLSDQRPDSLNPLNVLIQVNLDGEQQKAGCDPDQIEALAARIEDSPRLVLRGLMAIPAPREQRQEQIAVFEQLYDLYAELKLTHRGVDTLSAGMSGDLEAAIIAGSTMVRVGTDLFGPRRSQT